MTSQIYTMILKGRDTYFLDTYVRIHLHMWSFPIQRHICPKDSSRNRPTDLCHNSIILSQMGGALKIVRDSRPLIIFDILIFFGPK